MDEDEVEFEEGMPVTDLDGASLGTLSALLIPEGEEEAEFLVVGAKGTERLLPFEAVLDVENGAVVLDVFAADFERFPRVQPGKDPTDAVVELAYKVYEEISANGEE